MANWPKDLENAITPEMVVAIVNDYLSRLTPEMWSWIPPRCTPSVKVKEPADIHHWHLIVSDECREPSALNNARLQEYAIVFLNASHRLDELDDMKAGSGPISQLLQGP